MYCQKLSFLLQMSVARDKFSVLCEQLLVDCDDCVVQNLACCKSHHCNENISLVFHAGIDLVEECSFRFFCLRIQSCLEIMISVCGVHLFGFFVAEYTSSIYNVCQRWI